MKRFKFLFLIACFYVAGAVWMPLLAQSYSSNGWIFYVNPDGTAALGKPVDEMWAYDNQLWASTGVDERGVEYTIWHGGMRFLYYTDHIASSLSLPSTVTAQTISWSDNAHAFVYTYGDTYTVTKISNLLLTGEQRAALTSVSIPGTITTIEGSDYLNGGAFSNCNFSNITIPSSVTTIGSNVFTNNASLASITIPASVTAMGNYVFQNCTGLQSADIQNSTIGEGQFMYSTLKDVTISDNVTTIWDNAFDYCPNIETLPRL